MQAAGERDGTTLLDNSLIVMASSLRTGHTRRNLRVLFASGGNSLEFLKKIRVESDVERYRSGKTDLQQSVVRTAAARLAITSTSLVSTSQRDSRSIPSCHSFS